MVVSDLCTGKGLVTKSVLSIMVLTSEIGGGKKGFGAVDRL